MSTCSCRTLWLVMSCFCQLTNCCCSCCSRCSSCASGADVVEPGHTQKTPRWERRTHTAFQLYGCEQASDWGKANERGAWECAGPPLALRSRKGQNHGAARFSFTKRTCWAVLAWATHTPHSLSQRRRRLPPLQVVWVCLWRTNAVSSANSYFHEWAPPWNYATRAQTHTIGERARRRLISLFWSKGGQGGGKLNDECQPAALEWNESVHGCGFLDQFLFRDELLAFIISVAWYLKFKI